MEKLTRRGFLFSSICSSFGLLLLKQKADSFVIVKKVTPSNFKAATEHVGKYLDGREVHSSSHWLCTFAEIKTNVKCEDISVVSASKSIITFNVGKIIPTCEVAYKFERLPNYRFQIPYTKLENFLGT